MDRLFSYLNTLDDDYYFFIANTVLGQVKTPFHKPVINNAILSFLLNPQNRENITASLDNDDRRYLTLIDTVGGTTAALVSSFFDDRSYLLALTALESLRDRLLLLKDGENYFINPVLEDAVRPFLDRNLAFGENMGLGVPMPHVDRNVLFSILNLLSNGSIPTREANVHHFRKSDRLDKVFPQFPKSSSLSFFTLLKELLVSSSAVSPSSGRFVIDRNRAERILDLDDLNLMIAAIGRQHGKAISQLLGILRNHSLGKKQASVVLKMSTSPEASDRILQELSDFGFISDEEDTVRLNPSVLDDRLPMSKVGVDSDMVVSYYGIPESSDILYLFADIEVCDNLVRYRITKDSFIRALDAGLDAKQISSYLGTSRHDAQFSMWMQSFSRISLYDGIVIRCSNDVSAIVTRHPKIRPHVIADLGNGSYVMDRSLEWQNELAYSMDLTHLPLVKGEPLQKAPETETETLSYTIAQAAPETEQPGKTSDSAEALKKDLLDDAKEKGCLTDGVKALIDARLIVAKSQIGKGFRYASMQTIGGFDYSAKLSAIRNLLRKKNPPLLKLELADETILVQPEEMMKGEGIIKVRILPQEIERSIPISSIFRVTVMRWTV